MDNSVEWIRKARVPGGGARPLFITAVQAGFPSPADDYIDRTLDLNELLIRHPAATFFIRAAGDSMKGAGITSGDILIVDRSEKPRSGSIIIAVIDGELTVKRLVKNGNTVSLVPENPEYKTIDISPESEFEVWGVVVHVIHTVE